MPAPPHERSKEEAMLAAEVDLLPLAFCEAFIGAVGGIDVRPYTLKLTLTTTVHWSCYAQWNTLRGRLVGLLLPGAGFGATAAIFYGSRH